MKYLRVATKYLRVLALLISLCGSAGVLGSIGQYEDGKVSLLGFVGRLTLSLLITLAAGLLCYTTGPMAARKRADCKEARAKHAAREHRRKQGIVKRPPATVRTLSDGFGTDSVSVR